MPSPATAHTDTTDHITRNRGTVVTVVEAISSEASPGARNPTPSVHSARVIAPVTATTAGCGSPASPARASVTNPMRSPQEKGADPEPEQDRGPVLRGREPIAVEEVCQ